MSKIPEKLQSDQLSQYLHSCGLKLLHQGKVRNTWQLENEKLLVVATDRISIFDFVLNDEISKKGEVLTALTHFWLTKVLGDFNNHLIPSKELSGANLAYDLKENRNLGVEWLPELPVERCLVVEDMSGKTYPFELIYRHHIGGSVYKKYLETGMAGGYELPKNLPKWSKLTMPIFTPSTKEEVGHDINVDAKYYYSEMEKLGKRDEAMLAANLASEAYSTAYAYAEKKGVLMLDTKLEMAGPKIIDEIFTPDSSRFVIKEDWEKAMHEKKELDFWDKQLVRNWGSKIETPFEITGINNLDPEVPQHVSFVHSLSIPQEIKEETTRRYLKIFKLITEMELVEYQVEEMGV